MKQVCYPPKDPPVLPSCLDTGWPIVSAIYMHAPSTQNAVPGQRETDDTKLSTICHVFKKAGFLVLLYPLIPFLQGCSQQWTQTVSISHVLSTSFTSCNERSLLGWCRTLPMACCSRKMNRERTSAEHPHWRVKHTSKHCRTIEYGCAQALWGCIWLWKWQAREI